ncbi:MAG: archease [bacterium]
MDGKKLQKFLILDHTADVRLRASGESPAELFKNAALGLFSLLSDYEKVRPCDSYSITASGTDLESLLVSFLSELIYQFEARQLLFSEIEIRRLDEGAFLIEATARGEKYDPSRHVIRSYVKGVTYHGLKVEYEESWTAEIVLDV